MTLKIKSGTSVDAILLAVVKCMTTILGLLTVRIISDNFTYSEYGTYNQAILIASSISSITILGFTDATNYYFNKFSSEKKSQEEYLSTIVIFQLCVGVIVCIFLILTQNSISDLMDNKELRGLIKWVALTPLLSNIIAIQQILFISIGKSKIIALRNFVISILKLFAVLLSVYFTKSIVTILAALLIFDIIQMFYFSAFLSRYGIQIHLKLFNLKNLRYILSYSLPLALFIVTNALMRETDKYIVSIFSNSENFAIYSNASRILPFAIIVDAFTTVLIPFITKCLHSNLLEKLVTTYKSYLNFSFVVMWIFITGAIISSSELMELLYGDKYVIGLPIFITYLLVSLVKFANFSFIFSCAGQTKIILKTSVIALLANIILSLLLYYMIGPIGCAIATLIVSIWVAFYYFYKTKTILNISPCQLIDFRTVFRIILQSLLVAVALYLLNMLLDDMYYVVRLVLTYGLYVLVLVVLNKELLKRYLVELNN